jgi:acyl-coenzyme A synthetase/AMP-(fatty) acid ligase
MYIRFHVKYPLFLSNVMKLEFCGKNTQISNFMKIRSVEAELLHADIRRPDKSCYMRIYGRPDRVVTCGYTDGLTELLHANIRTAWQSCYMRIYGRPERVVTCGYTDGLTQLLHTDIRTAWQSCYMRIYGRPDRVVGGHDVANGRFSQFCERASKWVEL